jgi:protein TonB
MPPPPYIPPPEVQVQVPTVMAPTITAVTNVKPPAEPVRTEAIRDPDCIPEYPPAARRANETGTVQLSYLVDVDGKVLESKIERSSGSRRLDEAAKTALALCKYAPGTVDGRPVRSRKKVIYVWKLE